MLLFSQQHEFNLVTVFNSLSWIKCLFFHTYALNIVTPYVTLRLSRASVCRMNQQCLDRICLPVYVLMTSQYSPEDFSIITLICIQRAWSQKINWISLTSFQHLLVIWIIRNPPRRRSSYCFSDRFHRMMTIFETCRNKESSSLACTFYHCLVCLMLPKIFTGQMLLSLLPSSDSMWRSQ